MNPRLRALLLHLQQAVDSRRLGEIDTLMRKALSYEPVERLPIVFTFPLPPEAPFQPYAHREIFADPEKMLYNELVESFGTSIALPEEATGDLPWSVRPNFGCVLIASLFGGRVVQVEDNPPWIVNEPGFDIYSRIGDCNPTDFSRGWCSRVVERYRVYTDILRDFPPLDTVIRRVLPDLQGPLDTAELLRGSEIFVDMYERPADVQRLLTAVATAQVELARALAPLVNDGPPGFTHQQTSMIRGGILLRGDTSIMLSPAMYCDQVAPHDLRALDAVGGGGIHSCGAFGHLVPAYLALPPLRCLDIGQPDLNDLDAIYRRAASRRVALTGIRVPETEIASGTLLDRFPTGVVLKVGTESSARARELFARYRESAARRPSASAG